MVRQHTCPPTPGSFPRKREALFLVSAGDEENGGPRVRGDDDGVGFGGLSELGALGARPLVALRVEPEEPRGQAMPCSPPLEGKGQGEEFRQGAWPPPTAGSFPRKREPPFEASAENGDPRFHGDDGGVGVGGAIGVGQCLASLWDGSGGHVRTPSATGTPPHPVLRTTFSHKGQKAKAGPTAPYTRYPPPPTARAAAGGCGWRVRRRAGQGSSRGCGRHSRGLRGWRP